MRNSKLIEIFKDGYIVMPLFLLKHYKKFKLSMEEFIFLMYLYNFNDNLVFNPKKIEDNLGISLNEVMNYIGVLTDKGFIKVEVIKNEKGIMEETVILEPFYNKLSLFTMEEINNTKNESTIFEVIEKEFARTLSPMEYEIIKAWLDNNISEELIKEAIKEATFNGVSNLRYIDKILYEWGKLGIKNAADVAANRKKRASHNEENVDVDLDIVDWNWFDEDE